MICVFFQLPMVNGPTTTFNTVNGVAATAAAEVTNTVEWLYLN